jgi:hypothetical protein
MMSSAQRFLNEVSFKQEVHTHKDSKVLKHYHEKAVRQ